MYMARTIFSAALPLTSPPMFALIVTPILKAKTVQLLVFMGTFLPSDPVVTPIQK